MPTDEGGKGGKREGKAYPHVRSLRFSDRDVERLGRLAAKLETTEVMVVRQAIREMAQREGLE